jgi:hypothetical protein
MVIVVRRAMLSIGLISTAAFACTSAQNTAAAGAREAGTEACFNVRNVDSFSPLHAKFVYLRLVGGEQYLLTLDSVYTSLPFATGIKISNEFSRVCSNTGARITFMDFSRPVFCCIIRVEAVASKEAAKKLVQDRTTPKGKG